MYAVTIFQENNDFKALCSDPPILEVSFTKLFRGNENWTFINVLFF